MIKAKRNNIAFLGIDLENDFFPGGSLGVTDGFDIVDPINGIITAISNYWKNTFRNLFKPNWEIIFSRDKHPEKTSHFDIWPIHCVWPTFGAQFLSTIIIPKFLTILSKGINPGENAYSAFDLKAIIEGLGINLEKYLKMKRIKTLFVAGLATDYCVKATVIDALNQGFKVYLIIDAIKAVNINPGDGEKAIDEMVQLGAIKITSAEVIKLIENQ
jgi:nicotinamidase/pyrazinamidase